MRAASSTTAAGSTTVAPSSSPAPGIRRRRPAALAAVASLLLTLLAVPATADTTVAPAGGDTVAPASGDGLIPAPDHLPQTPRVDLTPQPVDLTFPVADPHDRVTFGEGDFLALRGGGSRLHAASDLMAPKHRAVHAAVGGVITFAPNPEPSYGWMVSIRGDDGNRYAYVHLNNDTPVRDADGRWVDDDAGGIEHAYAPRIVEAITAGGTASGLRIERGELLGWLGDSGNAKGVASHLHFEIHRSDDLGEYRIDPYPSLMAALDRGDVPSAGAAGTPPAPAAAPDIPFTDVSPEGVHTEAILRLAARGIVTGCDDQRYCPRVPITRGDLAAAVAAAAGLTPSGTPEFTDVSPDDPNAGAIAVVNRVGILAGYGDGRFGPDDPLSRAQLATMLVQAFHLPRVSTPPPFLDVPPDATHASTIASAHRAGLTRGCGDGTRYCGWDPVSREQIASFLDSAVSRS